MISNLKVAANPWFFPYMYVYPLISIWARFLNWKAAKGCIYARLARLELQIVGRSFNHLAVKNKRFLLILLCAMAFQGNLHRALAELCATTWTSHLHVVDRHHLIHSISFHSIPSCRHSFIHCGCEATFAKSVSDWIPRLEVFTYAQCVSWYLAPCVFCV